MKKTAFLFFFCLIAHSIFAQKPKAVKAWSINGDSTESCKIVTDSKGSLYVAGSYLSSSLHFGNTQALPNNGSYDIFIARYDTSGNLIWTKQFGGPGYETCTSITTDINGDIIIGGNFNSTINFDGTILTTQGEADIYFAKLNKSGTVLWAKQMGGTASETLDAISTDTEGNLYLCGQFYSTLFNFQQHTLAIAPDSKSLFYGKLDSQGNSVWVNAPTYVEGKNFNCINLKVAANGNVFLCGSVGNNGYAEVAKLDFLPWDQYLPFGDILSNVVGDGGAYFFVQLSPQGTVIKQFVQNGARYGGGSLSLRKGMYLCGNLSYLSLGTSGWVGKVSTGIENISENTTVKGYSSISFRTGSTQNMYNYEIVEDNYADVFTIGRRFISNWPIDEREQLIVLKVNENLQNPDTTYLIPDTIGRTSTGRSVALDTITNTLFFAGTYLSKDNVTIAGNVLPPTILNYDIEFQPSDILVIKAFVVPAPLKVNAGPDTMICINQSVSIGGLNMVTGGRPPYNYSWSPAAGLSATDIPNPVVTPVVSGDYIITVTDINNNIAKDTIRINIVSPTIPLVTANRATTFCLGDQVTLTSSAGNNYAWSTGATTQDIIITAPGSYTVTQVSAEGCSATSAPITITVNALPAKPVITADGLTTFCEGASVKLSASAANNYTWSTGLNTRDITVATSGIYTVAQTSVEGCTTTSEPVTVLVNPLPAKPVITADGPLTFCEGEDVVLTSSTGTGNNYSWSTGTTTKDIVISIAGIYSVTQLSTEGCAATSEPVTVIVHPTPAIPIVSADGPLTFCEGGDVILTSSTGNNYSWNTGAITQSIVVTASGSYDVTHISEQGCSAASAPVIVVVESFPDKPLITQDGNTLSSSAANGNQWYNEGILLAGETNQTLSITAGSQYSVTVTNSAGCSVSSETYTAHLFRLENVGNEQFYHQEFPNPVTNDLTITYTLGTTAKVSIEIIDLNGKNVMIVQNEQQLPAGNYSITKKNIAGIVGQGVYFICYRINNEKISKQLIIQ